MYRTLTFKDDRLEDQYESYSHPIEFNLFRRLLWSMLLGSFSGSIYNVIVGDYMYAYLGTGMLIQTWIALVFSRKSIQWLNFLSFFYQLEIQTMLIVLITQLNNNLDLKEVMIITSSAFQLSVCLSIGTKCLLKIFIIVYTSSLQVILGNTGLLWSGFCFFSMVFALQVTYFQEESKRQKYLLQRNSELIKTNLINQIEIPVMRCKDEDKFLKLTLLDFNKTSTTQLNVTEQKSFNTFMRETVITDQKTRSNIHKDKDKSKKDICLEEVIRKFSQRKIEQLVACESSQCNYAMNCNVKYLKDEYKCQLILLNEEDPYCLIFLQKKYDDQIHQFKQKIQFYSDLIKRLVQDSTKSIIESIELVEKCKLLREYRNSLRLQKLASGIFCQQTKMLLFHINCKLRINHNLFNEMIKPFSIRIMINKILEMLDFNISRKQCQIHVDIPQIDILLEGYPIKSYFVLLNLISNAIEFSHGIVQVKIIQIREPVLQRELVSIQIKNSYDPHNQLLYANRIKFGIETVEFILKEIGFRKLFKQKTNDSFSVQCLLFKKY